MLCPTIIEIIAIHRSDDYMLQSKSGDSLSDILGLEWIKRSGFSCRDIAERASASADRAHYHHCRMPLSPTFADVRTCRLLADCMKVPLPHQVSGFLVDRRCWRLHSDPRWLALGGIVRPVRLFRMAGCGEMVSHGFFLTHVTLEVDSPPIGIKHRLVHHFREGRVWEHRVHKFGFGGLQGAGDRVTLNHFGDLGADHMRSQ